MHYDLRHSFTQMFDQVLCLCQDRKSHMRKKWLKVNRYTFRKSNPAVFILAALMNRDQLSKGRICSTRSIYFPLKENLLLAGLRIPEKQTGSIMLLPLWKWLKNMEVYIWCILCVQTLSDIQIHIREHERQTEKTDRNRQTDRQRRNERRNVSLYSRTTSDLFQCILITLCLWTKTEFSSI